jgi:hypothetical protein
VVVDEQQSKPYDSVGEPVFSPDGGHVAYVARLGEKWHVVIDGQARGEYNGILEGSKVKFDAVGRLHFLAGKGRTLLLVEATISGQTGKPVRPSKNG